MAIAPTCSRVDFCPFETEIPDANLFLANLTDTQGLTKEQLSKAYLCDTKLPPAFQSLANRDCEMLNKRVVILRSPTP